MSECVCVFVRMCRNEMERDDVSECESDGRGECDREGK